MTVITRRQFGRALRGAAAWPLAARAQQGNRVRRIGVLIGIDENDPLSKPQVSTLAQALADLGWTDGRNLRMDLRWGGGDTNRMRRLAQELVGLQPDIIVTGSTAATAALQRETRTIPVVFAGVGDPVASALVPRLDHPSGNVNHHRLRRLDPTGACGHHAPTQALPPDGSTIPSRRPQLAARDQARWLRMLARRDGERVRLISRRGVDWGGRFPLVVAAVEALAARSCTIDGEGTACDGDGLADFELLRYSPPSTGQQ
jgi:hypothetical protein